MVVRSVLGLAGVRIRFEVGHMRLRMLGSNVGDTANKCLLL